MKACCLVSLNMGAWAAERMEPFGVEVFGEHPVPVCRLAPWHCGDHAGCFGLELDRARPGLRGTKPHADGVVALVLDRLPSEAEHLSEMCSGHKPG